MKINLAIGPRARKVGSSLVVPVTLIPLLFSSMACSLLFRFEASPVDAGAIATPVDAGADASTEVGSCGPALVGTRAYFSMDNVAQPLVDDVSGGIVGIPGTINDAGALVPGSASSVTGRCGQALGFPDGQQQVVSVPNEDLLPDVEFRSFDFWFQLHQGAPKADQGLVAKDGLGGGSGDILVRLDISDEDYRVVVRLQNGLVSGEVDERLYLCGPVIDPMLWHHVAVSLDGNSAKLFVDGMDVSSLMLQEQYAMTTTVDCGIDSGTARSATLSDNVRDWSWGGINSTAPSALVKDFFAGSLDELRFRDALFSAQDAARIQAFIAQE